jgi:tRNA-specific 2-thiouridylase
LDRQKDQSYVLHTLEQEQLAHTIFPLGEYTKPQVRQLAHELNLPVAERPESQDLCFLGEDDYRTFLMRHSSTVLNPGPILDRDGKVLGKHSGLAFFTIGQRKGIHISSPNPLYVLDKDPIRNALIVGPHEALGKNEFIANQVNWISRKIPVKPFKATIKIRYKAHEISGLVTPLSDQQAHVKFLVPLRDITPGQAAVFYDNETCLGGGIIQ